MFEPLTLTIPQRNMVTLAMKFTDVEAPIIRRQMIKTANVLLHARYVPAIIRSLMIKYFLGTDDWPETTGMILDLDSPAPGMFCNICHPDCQPICNIMKDPDLKQSSTFLSDF